ncbi:alpha/beta fold hydrolase [Olivibacter ginsenosidimutans]|uniref:Alpha/beta fold hydrolase n=1 Tax=Olivibacter ginsenosidimutans TaxID=1176537 RepID=A0ABP9BVY4_9SPHI
MHSYLSIKQKKIRIGDISIAYLEKFADNPRKTIIFIHGFPFNKNMWIDQLAALPSDIHGLALDVRGHGRSTIGHGYFSIDVFAKDLIRFIEQLGLFKVVLCGISMGGYIALRVNELMPTLIEGLVLVSTNAQADNNAAKIKRFDTIQSVLKFGRRTFAIGFVKNVFSEESLKTKQDAVELIRSSIRRNDVRSICATLLALASRTDTSASLNGIPFQVLIIKGEEDKLMTMEQANQLKMNIPQAELMIMKQCGHLPNLESPEQFNQLLHRYLGHLD